MTKEEIKDKLGDAISNNVPYNDSRHIDAAEEQCAEIAIEYAKQQSIAFAEWLNYERYKMR